MLRVGCLICLSFPISIFATRAPKAKNPALLKRKGPSRHGVQHRRGQSVCAAPSGGCNFGLWNVDSCECSCIPPYCVDSDSIFQSCVTRGTCPDPFEGCAPYVNCPYFPNPTTGLCESGPTIVHGVFEIFRTAEECCTSTYPDVSSCIQTPPSASPSLSPSVKMAPQIGPETAEGQIEPQPTDTAPSAGELVSQPSDTAPTTGELVSQPTDTAPAAGELVPQATDTAPTAGELLEPIQITFNNLPSQFELNRDRRGEMTDIIHNKLKPTTDKFNITLKMDIVDGLFSDQAQTLPLELHIVVMGASRQMRGISVSFLHDELLKALQDEVYSISDGLKEAWGPETYTNSVILSIGSVQTTSSPTLRPAPHYGLVAPPPSNYNDGGPKGFPVWAVVLPVVLFIMFCGGLFLWRRGQVKDLDRQLPDGSSYFEGASSFIESTSKVTTDLSPSVDALEKRQKPRSDLSFNQSHSTYLSYNQSREMEISFTISRLLNQSSDQTQRMDESSIQSRHSQMSHRFKSHRMDQSINGQNINSEHEINREHCIDQSSTQSSNQSRRRVQLDPPEENNDRGWAEDRGGQNPYRHVLEADNEGQISTEEDDELETGYDGGKSSFLVSRTNEAEDEDSSDEDEGVEGDESDGNVLGLLYYADASSADESEAKKSGKSRRSGRTGRSRYTSSGSTGKLRHSPRKLARTKSSRPKSGRRKKRTSKKTLEGSNRRKQQYRHPRNVFDESERQHAYATKPVAGDKLSESTVYMNAESNDVGKGLAPTEEKRAAPQAERLYCTHVSHGSTVGSTIRTNDNHRQSFAQGEGSGPDDYGLSFNSACQFGDYFNDPETKV